MLRRYQPVQLIKTVAAAVTPEFLDPDGTMQLYGLTFYGDRGLDTPNTGDVWIQVGGVDALLVEPERERSWPMPPYEAAYFIPTDFKIRVENDGDGIRVISQRLL